MFAALLSLAVSFAAIDAAPADATPVVCEDVDLISVAHLPDDVRLVFFFAEHAGAPAQIDHRWLSSDMVVVHSPEGVTLAWLDEQETPCYRIVRATPYLESWERESPLVAQNNKPWFVQLCEVGLKPPK